MDQEHDKHNDLFRHMADKLRNHTEPYRQGAWERFATKSGVGRLPKRKAWPYWAAAAMLVAAMSVVLLMNRTVDPQTDQYATSVVPAENMEIPAVPVPMPADDKTLNDVQEPTTAPVSTSEKRAFSAGRISASAPEVLVADIPAVAVDAMDDKHGAVLSTDLEMLVAVDTGMMSPALVATIQTEVIEPVAAIEDAMFDTDAERGNLSVPPALGESQPIYAGASGVIANERDKRWDLSVVLSPSMTSEKLNMGGGVALAYRISDKLSVSSGVSFSEMGVGQHPAGSRHGNRQYSGGSMNFDAPQASPVEGGKGSLSSDYVALGGSYLTSVTSSLLAMDVPLDIRYHVTERFYSSVGVSMFAVLDERRTVHYTTTTVNQNLNGLQYSRHEFSQKTVQQPIADQRFGGFLNLSVGHRLPLSKRVSLSFEPYFKLPIGSLSHQDMNLTHGGLKFVTGF